MDWRRSPARPDAVCRDDRSCPASAPTPLAGQPAPPRREAPKIRVAASRHLAFGRHAERRRSAQDITRPCESANAYDAASCMALPGSGRLERLRAEIEVLDLLGPLGFGARPVVGG